MMYVEESPGTFAPASDEQIVEQARAAAARLFRPGLQLTGPEHARQYLPTLIGTLDHERFGVAFLDSQHRMIAFELMFRGDATETATSTREIARTALKHNAVGVILAHNHPGGIAEPSEQDLKATARIATGLALLDIKLLDHYVVTADKVYSMREQQEKCIDGDLVKKFLRKLLGVEPEGSDSAEPADATRKTH